MEFETQDTQNEDRDPTPEEEAEILGEEFKPETPAETKEAETEEEDKSEDSEPPELPALPEKEGETKAEPSEDEKKTGEEEQGVTTYTKDQIDSIIKDRLGRFQKDLQTENQQLRDEIETLKKSGEPEPTITVPEEQDIGKLLNDPMYNGYTLEDLKDSDDPNFNAHYLQAYGRIHEKLRLDRITEENQEKEAEKQRAQAVEGQLAELKKLDPKYFDPNTGKGNDEYLKLVDFAEEKGIYNLPIAHVIMNLDTYVEAEKKKAIDDYIKEVTKNGGGIQRASTTSSEETVVDKAPSAMNDEELQNAYLNAKTPEEEANLTKIMEKRGLL